MLELSTRLHEGVLAERATDLIASASRFGKGTVFLPAYYCAEVVDAIETGGCRTAVYDVQPDLTVDLPSRIGTGDVVVWHHPFGLRRRPPDLGDGVNVLEDACYALRSFVGREPDWQPRLLVFSVRKELGWPCGGISVGPAAARTRGDLLVPPGLEAALTTVGWHSVAARGHLDTAYARERFGDLLPPAEAEDDVMTVLPLWSDQRDRVVETLRSRGVPAWYWQRRVPGCDPVRTPGAWQVWKHALLLPLPAAGSQEYELVEGQGFIPWPVVRH